MRSVTTMDEKIFTKFVSSFVLGDGALSSLKSYARMDENGVERPSKNNKKKNSHYYFKQLSSHLDYTSFQSEVLEYLTPVYTITAPAYIDNRGYNCSEQINISTRYHPFYTKMRERVYFEGKKQLDPHYMKLWDEQTVCFFYMDNGWIDCSEKRGGDIYKRVALATHAYSYGDVSLFKDWMKERFDFNFDIKRHKQKSGEYKFYLQNSKDNSSRFLDAIYKYCFPSFEYKFSTERFTPYKNKGGDIV